MKPLVSSDFRQAVQNNPGWNELLGDNAFADARRSATTGVLLAVVSGAAYLASHNKLVRIAAIGASVGGLLGVFKDATDGLAFKQNAARLKKAKALRPEPVLPKPPVALATGNLR